MVTPRSSKTAQPNGKSIADVVRGGCSPPRVTTETSGLAMFNIDSADCGSIPTLLNRAAMSASRIVGSS